jgi:tetratricopeptide (TPR) repeat protein
MTISPVTASGGDDLPPQLFREAVRLLAAGDPAVAGLLPALERFPDYGPGWLAIADVMRRAKQRDAALLALRRAAQAKNAPPAVIHHAGQGLAQLGQGEAAIAAFRRALSLDPGFAAAWYSLGLVLQDARKLAEAAEAYRAAHRLQPNFYEAAFNSGVALQEDGRLEEALDAYAEALQIKPESFGRIAQALISSPTGSLWLRPADLRLALANRAAGCLHA